MNIDFIPDTDDLPDAAPILRLTAFTPDEIEHLRHATRQLASGVVREYALHDQEWVTRGSCVGLLWRRGTPNGGCTHARGDGTFVLTCDAEGWLEVSELLEPFIREPTAGFQWLTSNRSRGVVDVLVSHTGSW